VPARIKLKRLSHDGWAWTQVLGAIAGVAFMIRQAVRG